MSSLLFNLSRISPEQAKTQKDMGLLPTWPGNLAFNPETDDPDDPNRWARAVKPVGVYNGMQGLASIGEGIHNAAAWANHRAATQEQRASSRAAGDAMKAFVSGGGMAGGPENLALMMRHPQLRDKAFAMHMQQSDPMRKAELEAKQQAIAAQRERLDFERQKHPLEIDMQRQRLEGERADRTFKAQAQPFDLRIRAGQAEATQQAIAAQRERLDFERQKHPLEIDMQRQRLEGERADRTFRAQAQPFDLRIRAGQAMAVENQANPTFEDSKRVAHLKAWGVEPTSAEGMHYRKTGEQLDRTPKLQSFDPDKVTGYMDPATKKWTPVQLPGNGTVQPKAVQDANAQRNAEFYKDVYSEGRTAIRTQSDLARLSHLSDILGAGKFQQWIAQAGPYLQSMNIEPRNLREAEAFNAIVSRMTPQMRPAGSGAASDKDMEIFRAALPQLSQTPQGRKLIIQQLQAVSEYNRRAGDIAGAYMSGDLSPQQARQMMAKLPNPYDLFDRSTGQKPLQAPGTQPGPATAAPQNMPSPKSREERDSLLPGTQYLDPTGQVRVR